MDDPGTCRVVDGALTPPGAARIQYVRGDFPLSIPMQPFFGVLIVLGITGPPAILIWGWVRWVKRPKQKTVPAILSLVGFVLATGSAVLALATTVYAALIHSFAFYDPTLMKIYGWGFMLSLGGIVLGVAGIWRPGSLRWHTPVSGVCMTAFWLIMVSAE
jgi:hypothetical protein